MADGAVPFEGGCGSVTSALLSTFQPAIAYNAASQLWSVLAVSSVAATEAEQGVRHSQAPLVTSDAGLLNTGGQMAVPVFKPSEFARGRRAPYSESDLR
jgi:hypothetical protein